MDKWKCNKCEHETFVQPIHKNSTCDNCHSGRYKLIRTCECGKEFHPDNYTKKYCSFECKNKYMKRGGKKGKHYPDTQRARIVVCETCGKEFRAIHEYKGKESKYCSKECWNIRARNIKHCEYCGREIITTKSANKKYCNNECRNKHYSIIYKGENSPAWKGGRCKEIELLRTSKNYKEWRYAVFNRDNFICQKCGDRSRDIEAHHIKEVANYPELIFDMNNGITLCHKCHKETDNYGYKVRKKIITIN